MCGEKGRKSILIFLAQDGTSHIENPAQRFDEPSGFLQCPVLLRNPDCKRARPNAPFRIWIAPPRPRSRTRRIDKNKIATPFETGKNVRAFTRRMELNIS